MTKFLIQAINGQVVHDFAFHLLESIKYINWFRNDNIHEFLLSEDINHANCIPVGSLEFVFSYLEKNYGVKKVVPINIPLELMEFEFLKRKVEFYNKKNIIDESFVTSVFENLSFENSLFVKSATDYKSFTEIIIKEEEIPSGNYIVSEVIEIDSEWRSFIYNDELVGLNHYSGDFTLFPDVKLIKTMINEYKNAPRAYTLDVGINKSGTFIIEVHPFVSCGLYGFRDYRILPDMFVAAFKQLID